MLLPATLFLARCGRRGQALMYFFSFLFFPPRRTRHLPSSIQGTKIILGYMMSLAGWSRHSETQHPLPENVSAVNHFRLVKPTASAHNRSDQENCSRLSAVLLIRKHAVFPCCRTPITTIYCGQPHFSDQSTPRGLRGPPTAVYHHREPPSRPPLPATPAVTDQRPRQSSV